MRIFIVDGREFPDPSPEQSIEEIRAMYATYFPELATAEAQTTQRGEDTVITFQRRVGTKG